MGPQAGVRRLGTASWDIPGPSQAAQISEKAGRNLLVYATQAVSRDPKIAGWMVPLSEPIHVATKLTYAEIAQVCIVPKATHYVVEVVHERPLIPQPVDPTRIASVDIGVNNLAAIASNKSGALPFWLTVVR
jgi:putative transposase